MNIGHFYFLSDQYFTDFPDRNLMQNKETINGIPHKRPCFYTFYEDSTHLFWMIPISSQVGKYESIYRSKIEKRGYCDTIVFGDVLGHKRAFLIQNMCPVISDYVASEYIDKAAGIPVRIDRKLQDELSEKARKVLALYRKGIPLIFPSVLDIAQAILSKGNLNEKD